MHCRLSFVLTFATSLLLAVAPSARGANGRVLQIKRELDSPQHQAGYQVINEANQNVQVVVGQLVKLKGLVTPWTAVNEWEWAISGENPLENAESEITSGYVFELMQGHILPPPPLEWRAPPTMDMQPLEFYWFKGGQRKRGVPKKVWLTAWLGGELLQGSETVQLFRPFLLSYVATCCEKIEISRLDEKGREMKEGRNMIFRIDWVGAIGAPTVNCPGVLDGRGRFGYIQVVNGLTYTSDGVNRRVTTLEKAVDAKDTADQPLYGNQLLPPPDGGRDPGYDPVQAGSVCTKSEMDLPSLIISDEHIRLLGHMHGVFACVFDTFAMYRPEGDHSIYVPVGVFRWTFNAELARITQTFWLVLNNQSTKGKVRGSPCQDPPRWSDWTERAKKDVRIVPEPK